MQSCYDRIKYTFRKRRILRIFTRIAFFSTKASTKYILLEKIVVVDGLRAGNWAVFVLKLPDSRSIIIIFVR